MLVVYMYTDYIIINQHPQNITLGKGNTLSLTVIASGPESKQFKYQWKKMNSNSFPTLARGLNTSNLIIPLVSASDNGSYYCVVTNPWGNTETSKKAIVKVLCKLLYMTQ